MALCLHEAGLPRGAFNLVHGGADVGMRLTSHPEVDAILFTGSLGVGREIVRSNAYRPECLIALELGGKNAALAFDDCDIALSARAIAFSAFVTAGQRCTASSRLFVTRKVAAKLIERIAAHASGIAIGHVLEPNAFCGPVITASARTAMLKAQARAVSAGYEPRVPGGAIEITGHAGHYLRPAVHVAEGVLEVAGYTDRELFGPDLAVHVVEDEQAALEAAARSRFGLAAAVFTSSREAFERAAEHLEVGVMHWNRPSTGASGRLPFGGLRQSGNHRPAGILAAQSCADPVAVLLEPASGRPSPSWPGFPSD
jgi:succinylglutamic semialdehyde dehydrogenase